MSGIKALRIESRRAMDPVHRQNMVHNLLSLFCYAHVADLHS